MYPQILNFIGHHWLLVAGFVLALILLFIEEIRSKSVLGGSLSPQAAVHYINRDQAFVIDVRDKEVFAKGHIVGAINLQTDVFASSGKLKKAQGKPVLLVDGNGMRTRQAASSLKKQGIDQVAILKGGIQAWRDQNLPLVKSKKTK